MHPITCTELYDYDDKIKQEYVILDLKSPHLPILGLHHEQTDRKELFFYKEASLFTKK